METFPPVPKLGVGLIYNEQLRPLIERGRDLLDFVELIPDIMWTDMGYGQVPRFIEDERGVSYIRSLRAEMAVVLHSIGFSVGSAHRFDREHIAQIARWHDLLKFPWHSDHLAFMFAGHGEGEINAGITMPLPYDEETIELLAPRISEMRARVPAPFLIENNVYFFKYERQDYDEATFLNRLCEVSGCRLLLDLHNLYTNCRNHREDPYAFLGGLNLENVFEIHVAGGFEYEGFYMDAHSGVSPKEVWDLLDWVLPKCANLGGVVFEMFGSWLVRVGEDGVAAQLSRMRELWARHQPAPASVGGVAA
jgi:uncharacterized protein (UPF0276 family)